MMGTFRLLFIGVFFLSCFYAKACEIEFKIVGKAKEEYVLNDELTIAVTVVLTHKICPIGIQATEFGLSGLEILKEEEWVMVTDRIYTKDIHIKVIGSEDGILKISGKRTCEKDGGFGELQIEGRVIAKPLD